MQNKIQKIMVLYRKLARLSNVCVYIYIYIMYHHLVKEEVIVDSGIIILKSCLRMYKFYDIKFIN